MLEAIIVVVVLGATLAMAAVAWSYRRFAAMRGRLVEHMRTAAPEVSLEGPTDAGMTVAVLGSRIEVDLATLWRQRRRGLAEGSWFDEVIRGIRARVPVPEAPPYPLVADRILPVLKPTAYVETFEHYPSPLRLAWRPLAPDAAVTYVIGGVHQWTIVTAGMPQAWGLSADALHALALENLRLQTARMLADLGGPQPRYEHLDGFDAARILVADLIVPPAIADPLLAIPEETVLLVAPASERSALAAEAAGRYRASARPLSPHVFRPTPAGPVAFD